MPQHTPTRRGFLATLLISGGIGLAGCAGGAGSGASGDASRQDQAGEPNAPITNTDPCAMRMHDLSGGLLLFGFLNGRLPTDLDELATLEQGPPLPPAVCPVSQQLYVYNSDGILLAERGEHVVLYDPAPSHAGHRWAVTVRDPGDGSAIVTKVIALPERFFLLRGRGGW